MKNTIIILTTLFLMAGTQTNAQKDELVSVNQLVIIANHQGPVISKDIYGHFSEHLGNCIYGGLWVGTDSKIPNTYGISNDVLFALRAIKVPNLRWPGGCRSSGSGYQQRYLRTFFRTPGKLYIRRSEKCP